MLKKNISIINKYFVLLLLIMFFLFSCSNKKRNFTYTLLYDIENSTVEKPFFRDSILIIYYGKDSILMKNYYQGEYFQNIYFNDKNTYSEKRYVSNFPEQIFETDTILTFSHEDTTFLYYSNRDDFIVTLVDLSLFNSKYVILQDEKGYRTIKQSLVDSTYNEIYYYDRNYNVYKFVNTWKDNECVYVRKEY